MILILEKTNGTKEITNYKVGEICKFSIIFIFTLLKEKVSMKGNGTKSESTINNIILMISRRLSKQKYLTIQKESVTIEK